MKSKLVAIFPEFNLIKDKVLRVNTLNVWIEAMTMAGWNVGDLKKIPFTLLIPGTTIPIVKHVQAVTPTAIEAARVINKFYPVSFSLNMDYITAGGL